MLAVAKRHPDLKIMEAFMYRHHPQWQKAKDIVSSGGIGALRTVHSFFSYFNDDPGNVRNIACIGGGGLMDIGCYNISLSRFIFDAEPKRVLGLIELDPEFQTDRLTSGILQFGNGTATFTCATQLTPYQRVNIYGTEGRIEIDIPFNAPPEKPCLLWHLSGADSREIVFPICDQYTLQSDLFAQAILKNAPVPTPLEDGVMNMKVIDAMVKSAKQSSWISLNSS
jgi:predicted dehydrogenase